MNFDYLSYPYNSKRVCSFARRGMVATSQPLAAQAGLEILKNGGNAVDAAVAAAACLTVVEPTSNGIGGDAFALVQIRDKLYGLNSSGPAPAGISIPAVRERGCTEMPAHGFIPVTVPGAPAAWAALVKRFGKLSLKEVLQPAVSYAAGGYPVSPTLGQNWQRALQLYGERLKGEEYRPWFETFAPGGRAPLIGEIWRSRDHARTLEEIGGTGGESFYRGELARRIGDFSRKYGGFIRETDLAQFQPEWVEPLQINYRGFTIHELPPNGQGLVALNALKIMEGFSLPGSRDLDSCHRQIEALKLAFADGRKYITDPEKMAFSPEEFLSGEYAGKRRKMIGGEALEPEAGRPDRGGTVYLAAADAEGNMVSYIQSNYMGFGSGLVVPGTGISLQNRGHTFSLQPDEANSLEPGKRTYHTIIPGFLSGENLSCAFGVMGGYMQPQGHLQVVMNMIDFKLNPQSALDAPRWMWQQGREVMVEHSFPADLARGLSRKGHRIKVALDSGPFGRGQIILRDSREGVLCGGTEPRTDGAVALW